MPSANSHPPEIILTVPDTAFSDLDTVARRVFERGFGELTHDQAMRLVGPMFATGAPATVTAIDGRTIVDTEMDGPEATTAAVSRLADTLAPRIDDDRTLIVRVLEPATFWSAVTGRRPRVRATFTFQPPPALAMG